MHIALGLGPALSDPHRLFAAVSSCAFSNASGCQARQPKDEKISAARMYFFLPPYFYATKSSLKWDMKPLSFRGIPASLLEPPDQLAATGALAAQGA
eukprot:bmy_11052T0